MVDLIEVMPVLCLAMAIVFLPLLSEEPPRKPDSVPARRPDRFGRRRAR